MKESNKEFLFLTSFFLASLGLVVTLCISLPFWGHWPTYPFIHISGNIPALPILSMFWVIISQNVWEYAFRASLLFTSDNYSAEELFTFTFSLFLIPLALSVLWLFFFNALSHFFSIFMHCYISFTLISPSSISSFLPPSSPFCLPITPSSSSPLSLLSSL